MDKILLFLRLCVSNPMLPISWGIANIVIKENYVAFTVNGNKYQGFVVICSEIGNLRVVLGKEAVSFTEASDALIWLDEHLE